MLGTLRFPRKEEADGTQRLRRYPFALPNLRVETLQFWLWLDRLR
jgi:hypothetical protein